MPAPRRISARSPARPGSTSATVGDSRQSRKARTAGSAASSRSWAGSCTSSTAASWCTSTPDGSAGGNTSSRAPETVVRRFPAAVAGGPEALRRAMPNPSQERPR